MTRCSSCGDSVGTAQKRFRARGREVCSVGCALELLTGAATLDEDQCPGCGEKLTGSAKRPEGYNHKHCASCVIDIHRRKGTLTGGRTA